MNALPCTLYQLITRQLTKFCFDDAGRGENEEQNNYVRLFQKLACTHYTERLLTGTMTKQDINKSAEVWIFLFNNMSQVGSPSDANVFIPDLLQWLTSNLGVHLDFTYRFTSEEIRRFPLGSLVVQLQTEIAGGEDRFTPTAMAVICYVKGRLKPAFSLFNNLLDAQADCEFAVGSIQPAGMAWDALCNSKTLREGLANSLITKWQNIPLFQQYRHWMKICGRRTPAELQFFVNKAREVGH